MRHNKTFWSHEAFGAGIGIIDTDSIVNGTIAFVSSRQNVVQHDILVM